MLQNGRGLALKMLKKAILMFRVASSQTAVYLHCIQPAGSMPAKQKLANFSLIGAHFGSHVNVHDRISSHGRVPSKYVKLASLFRLWSNKKCKIGNITSQIVHEWIGQRTA